MAAAAGKKSKDSYAKVRKNAAVKTLIEKKNIQAKSGSTFENPLVPHLVLRQMFQKIVEVRLLEGHLLSLKGKGERVSQAMGQEACRVSLAQGLIAGDVVLDSQRGEVMQHLLGASLAEVMGTANVRTAAKQNRKPSMTSSSRLLPFVKEAEERLFTGIGAAIMVKHLKRVDATVVFVEHHDVSKSVWKRALTLAGTRKLPIIFVVLPTFKAGRVQSEAEMSGLANRYGVPGISVDSSDTVALYRVAQEALGRIRAGGGAVLLECIPFHAPRQKNIVVDPVEQLKAYLMHRRVSSTDWFAEIEKTFEKLLLSFVKV